MGARTARAGAARAGDNPLVERGARLGYAATGVLHLLLAWVCVQLAWSGYGGSADQDGALGLLAGSTVGAALLWLCVAGFALLALWHATEAVAGHETSDRLRSAGRALVHAALAVTTVGVLRGGSGGASGGATEGATAGLMAQPAGRVLLGAVGLAVVAVGAYHVVKGWRRTFLEDLKEHPGTWTERAGRVGYVAKGVALGVVGGLLVTAAAGATSQAEPGLDPALRALLALPAGAVLLTLVGLGFAAYGVYSFARARHADL
ncbi:DUF1206 domain-containing protein [Actinotalea ferrariae]|uniref:DUF1206 domain-containing protein n=1 Tax=Actinotalea ferrariae TaxID=1386098 RepID=UPI001C8C5BAA|nr:DUF1206 domain-containing protein [Actinotalea ferrariae]MBX9245024.1 DUF1206 domain-containing protein [Actinotalea ferrariae]